MIDMSECGLGYLQGLAEIGPDGRCHHPFDAVGVSGVTAEVLP